MMEINSTSSEKELPEEMPDWESYGRKTLYASLIVASFAVVPALTKKKRAYTIVKNAAPIQPALEIIDIPVINPPNVNEGRFPRSSKQDEEIVTEIFTTIATKGMFSLAASSMRLNQIGNELRQHNQHPFDFLRCAPKEHVRTIFNEGNYFKIEGVMKGVIEGMRREKANNNLEKFIPDFANVMGKQPELILELIRACNWKGLVCYLFDIKSSA